MLCSGGKAIKITFRREGIVEPSFSKSKYRDRGRDRETERDRERERERERGMPFLL